MELADYIKTMKRGEKVPALFIVVLDSELADYTDGTETKRIEGGAFLKAQNCAENRGMQELRAQLETRVEGGNLAFFRSFEVEEEILMHELGAHAWGLQIDPM